ncbi:MAG: hypothetical protein LUG93_05710 [Lachnospiraceae bacterium]|nr:hypothetical protein [Lachnospiraceae bacterium]
MIKEFIIKMRDENEQKISSLECEMSELVRDLSLAEQLLEKMLREKKSDTYIFSPRTTDFQIDEKIRAKQTEIRELNQKIDYVRHMMEERLKNRDEFNNLLNEIETSDHEKSSQDDQKAESNAISVVKSGLTSVLSNNQSREYNSCVTQEKSSIVTKEMQKNPSTADIKIPEKFSSDEGKKLEIPSTAEIEIQKNSPSAESQIQRNLPSSDGEKEENLPSAESKKEENLPSAESEKQENLPSTGPHNQSVSGIKKGGESVLEAGEHKAESSNLQQSGEAIRNAEINKEKLLSFLQAIYKDTETCLALINGNKNRCKTELRKMMKSISEYKKMIETDDVS